MIRESVTQKTAETLDSAGRPKEGRRGSGRGPEGCDRQAEAGAEEAGLARGQVATEDVAANSAREELIARGFQDVANAAEKQLKKCQRGLGLKFGKIGEYWHEGILVIVVLGLRNGVPGFVFVYDWGRIEHWPTWLKGEEVPVLVRAVNFVDGPQHIIAPFVRLEAVDEHLGFGGDLLYFVLRLGKAEFLNAVGDRKRDVSGTRLVIEERKRAHQIIETHADIVYGVRGGEIQLRRDGRMLPELDDAGVLRIDVADNGVTVRGVKTPDFVFESNDVLIGPL